MEVWMPPLFQFTKSDLVQAAFNIVREEGLENLSARAIAARLKSSTSPIYSLFGSMEALEKEVVEKIVEMKVKYETTQRTGLPYLDVGLGYILFAREEKQLFRSLFQSNYSKVLLQSTKSELAKLISKDPLTGDLKEEQLHELIELGWYYIHGIASLSNIEFVDMKSEAEIVSDISKIAVPFIESMKAQK
jgi:AcrR family transcriptional regulator